MNEIFGRGTHYDFGDRYHDARIGRIGWSTDRLFKNYPGQSPYVFAGNCPIRFIDKNGQFKLDPTSFKDYPIIYAYLSSQIEKDVMKSTTIRNAYKSVNPDVTDNDIRSVFKNNSGPVLYGTYNPGGERTAAGHHDYNPRESVIEINQKTFDYVENILKYSKSKEERLKATLLLFEEVIHEAGHEMIGFKGGKKVNQGEYNMRDSKGDPGNAVEYATWGINQWQSEDDRNKPSVVEGVEPQNPKNREGQLEKNIEHSIKVDGGQSLPTVP